MEPKLNNDDHNRQSDDFGRPNSADWPNQLQDLVPSAGIYYDIVTSEKVPCLLLG